MTSALTKSQLPFCSATKDSRFRPIEKDEFAQLSLAVSLLTNFEPCAHAMDWTIAVHGLSVVYRDHAKGRKYSATYLPQVALEAGKFSPYPFDGNFPNSLSLIPQAGPKSRQLRVSLRREASAEKLPSKFCRAPPLFAINRRSFPWAMTNIWASLEHAKELKM